MKKETAPLLASIAALVFFSVSAALATSVQDIVNAVSLTSYTDMLSGTNTLYAHNGNLKGMDGGTDHNLTRNYIESTFTSYGLSTSLQGFTFMSGNQTYSGSNVVAVKPGAVTPEKIYVLGGHYDTINNFTGTPDAGTPGADDNASGIAGVLEAARVMSQFAFDSTLVFIGFDAEEEGLYGSAAYVQAHLTDNICGMIALDMIAYNPGGAGYNKAYACGRAASDPIKTALMSAVATYSSATTPLSAALDGSESSDHYSFEQAGFQAALLFEGAASNPNYHLLTDSVDTPGYIDYAYGTAMTRSAVGYLAENAMVVPEPGMIGLLAFGFVTTLIFVRKKKKGPFI